MCQISHPVTLHQEDSGAPVSTKDASQSLLHAKLQKNHRHLRLHYLQVIQFYNPKVAFTHAVYACVFCIASHVVRAYVWLAGFLNGIMYLLHIRHGVHSFQYSPINVTNKI